MAELEEAARHALTGQGDPEVLRRISERAARVREEIRQKHGTLDVAVSLIREAREEE
jgi:hypothetical protein